MEAALAALPQRHAERTTAAAQRLAFARVLFGAGSARWTAGAGALADDPYGHGALRCVDSRTKGAPMRPILAEARYRLGWAFSGARSWWRVEGAIRAHKLRA